MVVTPSAASARVDHTYLKRGVYYFNRRVPLDVSQHYKSRRINFSLRTKSVRTEQLRLMIGNRLTAGQADHMASLSLRA